MERMVARQLLVDLLPPGHNVDADLFGQAEELCVSRGITDQIARCGSRLEDILLYTVAEQHQRLGAVVLS